MGNNILHTAMALPDGDLIVRIAALARTERETTAELVAHLAALELRPSLYLAQGYGSLFRYCTGALRLSEDAACNRIQAAHACQRFPVIVDLLAAGTMSLTAVRLLEPHLTAENHEAVLARAANRSKEDVAALVAELAPKPDVVSLVRKLPRPRETQPLSDPPTLPFSQATDADVPPLYGPIAVGPSTDPPVAASTPGNTSGTADESPCVRVPTTRPVVRPLSPSRYKVQFTIGQETYEKLRWVQAMLRREIPKGDPAEIFDRALDLLREEIEKTKLGNSKKAGRAYDTRIRPGTDRTARDRDRMGPTPQGGRSRHIPNRVKRAVRRRDAGQCAFVSDDARRCTERAFLELHHIQPYALDGPATVENIALRCRGHNQYEADAVFGPRGASTVGKVRAQCGSPPQH